MQIHKSDPYYFITGIFNHWQSLLSAIPIFISILGFCVPIFADYFL